MNGVVYKNVQVAEVVTCPLGRGLGGRLLTNIGGSRNRPSAGLLDVCGSFGDCVRVDVYANHRGPFNGKPSTDSSADATASPRYDRGLPI